MGIDAALFYRAMFVDLDFGSAQEDLMAKFTGCLVLLPNLKTLEVFSTNRNEPFLGGLRQKSARFPSVRELGISEPTVKLVGNCPNVEGVTIRGILFSAGAALLGSHGKELKKVKRVAGVHEAAVGPGKLKYILASCAHSLTMRHGSRAGLSGPPRNLHQGHNWALRCT